MLTCKTQWCRKRYHIPNAGGLLTGLILLLALPNTISAQCSPDTTDPVINCPSDITVGADPGVCGANVLYPLPTATDNCVTGTPHPTSIPGYSYLGIHNGHSYFLSDDSVQAEIAANLAIAIGGHLVSISDGNENALVSSFTTKEFWIGLADTAQEGVFEWINGEPVGFTNWAPGEPNDFKNREDWGTLNYQGEPEWNDRFGNDYFHFIVEFDPIDAIPANKVSGPGINDFFPVGTTPVTYEAVDSAGNKTQCSFNVTVLDTATPTAICQDITVSLDQSGQVNISPSDLDGGSYGNCSALTLSASKTNFNYSELGKHTVTLTVLDGNGRSDSCEAIVTVPDTVPLEITCPADIVVDSDPNSCGANVNFNITATGAGTVVESDYNSGDFFPIGTTTVSATATNAANETTDCSFNITVEDNESPTFISCPSDTVVPTSPGQCSAEVNYPDPVASDNCDPNVHPSSLPGFTHMGTFNNHTYFLSNSTANVSTANSTAQSLGAHLVTISDSAENLFVSSFSGDRFWMGFTDTAQEGIFEWITGEPVTYTNWDVANGEPNNFNGIEHWTVMNFTGQNGLWNDYRGNGLALYVIEFDDGVFPVNRIAGPPSGSTFPIGTTTIVYNTTDPSGNSQQCSFDITVEDQDAPIALCKNINIQLEAGGVVSIDGADIDNGSHDDCGIASMVVSPNSFTCSDIGPNSVVLTVTDNGGNQSTCNATVNVGDNSNHCSSCVQNEIVSLDLVSVNTGGLITSLTDNYVINKATIIGNFSIEAVPCNGPVGSVVFNVNGSNIQTESVAPYAINGDSPPGSFTAWKPAAGTYIITATPYTNSGGNGTAGIAKTVTLEVVDSGAVIDCNGDTSGTAFINACDSCVGGNTGRALNYGQDDCGVCNGNNADKDCNGECFGSASYDKCNECSGGSTGIVPNSSCNVDCHGDIDGTATLDDCGICSGGNTGILPNADKDTCGVCFGDNTSCAPCDPLEVTKLVLVDVNTGTDITTLTNGAIINKSIHSPFSVRADLCVSPVGSVIFTLDGNKIQTENIAPYSIAGDNSSGYQQWNPPSGTYVLSAIPYSGGNGNGTVGTPETVTITIVDSAPLADCAGVIGGTAFINACDSCVGGTTGNPINYGEDDCGVCNGNDSDKDCFGDCFGSAVVDSCNECVLGSTGKTFNNSCNIDCNGDVDGTATLDDCGICSGGNTGITPNVDKDTCGVCFGDNLSCAPCQPLEVVSLTLVDVASGNDIAALSNGYVIDISVLGYISVRADVCDEPSVGSVRFFVDGSLLQNENLSPFAIQGDNGGIYKPWSPSVGSHNITATPYSGGNGNGATGISKSVNIVVIDAQSIDCNGDTLGTAFINDCDSCVGGNTGRPIDYGKDDCGVCNGSNEAKDCYGDCFGSAVVDSCGECVLGNTGKTFNNSCSIDCNGDLDGTASLDDCGICSGGNTGLTPNADKDTCGVCFGNNFSCAPCVPLEVVSMTLMNTGTTGPIRVLKDNDTIIKSQVGNFNIRADLCSDTAAESVEFELNGSNERTESVPPYAIAGDAGGSYYSWNIAAGQYTLTATPYSGNGGGGTAGVAKSINLWILDAPLLPSIVNSNNGSDHTSTMKGHHEYTSVAQEGDDQVSSGSTSNTLSTILTYKTILRVYPNPTTGNLWVEIENVKENAELMLMDASGKIILQEPVPVSKEGIRHKIELDSYAKGIYLIKVRTGEEVHTWRVIKK